MLEAPLPTSHRVYHWVLSMSIWNDCRESEITNIVAIVFQGRQRFLSAISSHWNLWWGGKRASERHKDEQWVVLRDNMQGSNVYRFNPMYIKL